MRHETDNWVLTTPDDRDPGWENPRVVLATIHPRGDQRVTKCIQSLLDAGCRLHIIWLGQVPETNEFDPWLSETVLLRATSTRDRLRSTWTVLKAALRLRGDVLYVHDFYMLPHGIIWKLLKRGRLLFDSHEHYVDLYAAKFPRFGRAIGRRGLEVVYRLLLAPVDAFSVVDVNMVRGIALRDRPVITTPNYPSRVIFTGEPRQLAPEMLGKVVHSGTLTEPYGSTLLVEAARIVSERQLPLTLTAIKRFPSQAAEQRFMQLYEEAGSPSALILVEPLPAHKMQAFIAEFGVGLSLIQPGGQNDLAVATKLYEYATVGLAVCATDLHAQGTFIKDSPGVIGRAFQFDSAVDMVATLEDLLRGRDHISSQVNVAMKVAGRTYNWEESCSPQFQGLRRFFAQRVASSTGERKGR